MPEPHQPRAGEQGALQQGMMRQPVSQNSHRRAGDLLVGQAATAVRLVW